MTTPIRSTGPNRIWKIERSAVSSSTASKYRLANCEGGDDITTVPYDTESAAFGAAIAVANKEGLDVQQVWSAATTNNTTFLLLRAR